MSPASGPAAAGPAPVTPPPWYAVPDGPPDLLVRLDAARDLPDGPERVGRLARLAAEADAAGATRLGLAVRLDLLDALDRAGQGGRMPLVLRRCRAVADRDPATAGPATAELLDWYQRRIVALAVRTTRIGLAEARALLADLERRRTRPDRSSPLRGEPPILDDLWCELADQAGDEPDRSDRLARWRAAGPESTGDCAACAACRQAEVLADLGTRDGVPARPGRGLAGRAADAAAVRAVEPVLAGRLSCAEQPDRALAAVVLPYLRQARYADAATAHVTAYRRHRTDRTGFPRLATHLRFCALTGHLGRGLDILTGALPRLAGPVDERSTMEFAAAGALVCRRAAGLSGRPGGAPVGRRDVAALGADLLATARKLARRFDARNGGTHQSRRLAGWLAEPPVPAAVPLPPDEE